MKPPSAIRIGAVDWTVQVAPLSGKKGKARELGTCTYEVTTLTLSPEQSAGSEKVTLLHELLHAVIYQARVELDENVEEHLLDNIDDVLLDTLSRAENEALRAYLFGERN